MKLFTIIFTVLTAYLVIFELDIFLKGTGLISNYAIPFFTDNVAPEVETASINSTPLDGVTAQVRRVIDGDTIDVFLNGEVQRVRYIGMNTPERDEPCYS
ncbi:MAG: hypothetical protein P8J61_10835 [Gammaproteobacteria bacterium]|nr:hypothetical protein [Gammaproteobacteria bacterium]